MVKLKTNGPVGPTPMEWKHLIRLVMDIDQKLSYVTEQLRKDLYILVPREEDKVFGGPFRGKRSR